MTEIKYIDIPILDNHDFTKQIGMVKIKDSAVKTDSCFSIGYIDKENGGIELLEVSLIKDSDYKKFLDKKYE